MSWDGVGEAQQEREEVQRDECDKQIFENKVQGNLCASGEQVPLAGDAAHLGATCEGSSSDALQVWGAWGAILIACAGLSLLAVVEPLNPSIPLMEDQLLVGAIFACLPALFFM